MPLEPVLLQARDVGAALVDEATERDADLLVLGLPYRKRFGGDFAIGRTIPYVLKNAPCAVWVVREPMPEEHSMKTVIVGCGRVGAALAEALDRAGHEVIIIDMHDARLRPPAVDVQAASAIRGDGTDEDVLRRAGTEGADLFLALTEGDNRNVMAAQLAAEALGVAQVVAKINDPLRAEAYAALGHRHALPDDLMVDAVMGFPGLGVGRESGRPGRPATIPAHHGEGVAADARPSARPCHRAARPAVRRGRHRAPDRRGPTPTQEA